jgi:hypothetical protein
VRGDEAPDCDAGEPRKTRPEAATVGAGLLDQVRADCKPLEECLRANVSTPKVCEEAVGAFESPRGLYWT